MHRRSLLDPAQTNVQLYRQLAGTDYLADAQRAHDLALELFSGQYRACGKPFLAHLVGTASILASIDARPALVLAGLVHSAYMAGRFRTLERFFAARRRERVRSAVGAEAERLIYEHAQSSWETEDRDLLLLRLANQLDDLLDAPFCSKELRDGTSAIAERHGLDELAQALAHAEQDRDRLALELGVQSPRYGSFTLGPATHRERVESRLERRARRLLARR